MKKLTTILLLLLSTASFGQVIDTVKAGTVISPPSIYTSVKRSNVAVNSIQFDYYGPLVTATNINNGTILFGRVPYTNLINGDTNLAFSSLAAFQTYVGSGFFAEASDSTGSNSNSYQKKLLTTFIPNSSGVVAAGDTVQRALEKLQYQTSSNTTALGGKQPTGNYLIVGNNLSDISSPSTALSNIGGIGSSTTNTLTNKNLTSGTNTFPIFNQNTTGNAATVTTNANLTGPVTSTGNATAIAIKTVNGRTILGTGDILGTTNTTAGYPTAYPTDYVFKSAYANGNAFGLALIDSLNRTTMSITPNGTMNLTDFSGLLGGVAVLRNAGTAVANEIAGHFAASSLDSLGNQSTKGYFIVTALNTSGVNQYSSVGLGYMDNVNAYPGGVYFHGEPNKFVNISHLGFILPTIPIKDVSGTVTMDATNFILKNSGVGKGININPYNDTLWDYFNLTATTTNNGVSFVTTPNGTATYPYSFIFKTSNGSAQYIYSNGTNNYITIDNTSNASPNSLVFGVAAASSSGLSANHALTINPGAGAFETITTTGVNLSGNVGLGSGFTTSTGTIQSTHGIFTTDLYGPLFFGGTAANSSLNLKSTSGVGTTDAIVFKVGNNGATEAGRFLDAGTFQLTTAPVTSAGTYNLLTWNTSTGAVEKSTALPFPVYYHGNSTTTGTATTAVTVTIGTTMAGTTYTVIITPKDLLTAVNYYISAQTTTTFTVTFVSALTGSINFDWSVLP